jgi:hypothetical protein
LKSARRLRFTTARSRSIIRHGEIRHSPADVFVGKGFRDWVTGFRTGELVHWERAFSLAEQTVGLDAARDVCRDFSQWVRLLSERSCRDLQVLNPGSACFCRDECVAMALIAAHQHRACPALQACAMTLLQCEPGGEVSALSESLADRLKAANQVLSTQAMDHVVRYAGAPAEYLA